MLVVLVRLICKKYYIPIINKLQNFQAKVELLFLAVDFS